MNSWLFQQDQNAGKMFADEAGSIYERAVTTLMKNNMLVYFAYADFEEVPYIELYLSIKWKKIN